MSEAIALPIATYFFALFKSPSIAESSARSGGSAGWLMIKTMEFSNYNLVRKINSAFIVTLPVFKQALAQAILLKRQKIQAESIAELDKKTNEMLLKNAQNTVDVSKMTAKMASGSSIQIETLEKTWATITNGIEETRRIQEDARKKRQEDQVRLEAIKQDFNKQYNVPPVRK